MAPKLYKTDTSPPARSVFLTAKALDINLEYVEVDLLTQDHLKPEFIKLNPQHTIPTLDDDGVIIWDSHAINAYLVTKYGKDDSLYPKDPVKRALVDQKLHFNGEILFTPLRKFWRSVKYEGVKSMSKQQIEEAHEAYDFVEKFLQDQTWLAGDNITIADFSVLASITTWDLFVPIDPKKYPSITAWIKRAQQLPYYEVNQKGIDMLKPVIKNFLG